MSDLIQLPLLVPICVFFHSIENKNYLIIIDKLTKTRQAFRIYNSSFEVKLSLEKVLRLIRPGLLSPARDEFH